MPEFSDYVIYADESGDHSLEHIDQTYPVFVLCLCLFRKKDYAGKTLRENLGLKRPVAGAWKTQPRAAAE